MNAEMIGTTAGRVWAFLAEHGPTSRAELKKALSDWDDFTLAAAVGWLAREDKVVFVESGRSFKIALK